MGFSEIVVFREKVATSVVVTFETRKNKRFVFFKESIVIIIPTKEGSSGLETR